MMAAPVLLFLSAMLSSTRAASSFTVQTVSSLCIAAMSLCSGAMLMARNYSPQSLDAIL